MYFMFSPPIQPSRVPLCRPMFAEKLRLYMDFSSVMLYSKKFVSFRLCALMLFTVMSPPFAKNMMYLAFNDPYHSAPM